MTKRLMYKGEPMTERDYYFFVAGSLSSATLIAAMVGVTEEMTSVLSESVNALGLDERVVMKVSMDDSFYPNVADPIYQYLDKVTTEQTANCCCPSCKVARGEPLTVEDRAYLHSQGLTDLDILEREQEVANRPKPMTEEEIDQLCKQHKVEYDA